MSEVEICPDFRHINIQDSIISFDRGQQVLNYVDLYVVG